MKKFYTKKELQEIIENVGIGYAIMDYVNPAKIRPKKLKEKWEEATKVMEEILNILDIEP